VIDHDSILGGDRTLTAMGPTILAVMVAVEGMEGTKEMEVFFVCVLKCNSRVLRAI
jgi:hypothetical protein